MQEANHHCQGLESDYSTSIIPPEQQGANVAEVTSLVEDLECDLRQRTKRDQVHVGTAL